MKSDATAGPQSESRGTFCVHELLVDDGTKLPPYGYLVVEVTRRSFQEACDYLRDTRWLDNDLAPLVLSHFPFSNADVALLPKRIPWMQATSEVQRHLDVLRTALVLPLEFRGLVCVNFADMFMVLANGGEARLSQASAPTALRACEALFSDSELRRWLLTAKASVSMHIRAPGGFSLSDFDLIGHRLANSVYEEAVITLSTGICAGDRIELTLLAVSTR